MCDWGISAAITSIVAAGVSAYSSYESGQSQKKASEYNAEMQNRAAKQEIQQGNIKAQEMRDRARKIAGTQAAGFGAAGLDTTSGTASDILDESRMFGELDALRSINNAQRTAYGLQAQSELDLWQGHAAARGGMLSAAGSLLSGASNAAYTYKMTRPPKVP